MKRSEGPAPGASLVPCWSCHGPVAEGLPFCDTCRVVQPPGQTDHFTRFGLAPAYDLDETALDRAYFELQRHLHPDRFSTRTARERALSQQQATSLNDAYETLKDPLKRADYLVHLQGSGVLPEGCDLVNDPVLLMEAMEAREQLHEAEDLADVERIAKLARKDIEDCKAELAVAFAGDRLREACRLVTRFKYLRKLADEARQRRLRLMTRSTNT